LTTTHDDKKAGPISGQAKNVAELIYDLFFICKYYIHKKLEYTCITSVICEVKKTGVKTLCIHCTCILYITNYSII